MGKTLVNSKEARKFLGDISTMTFWRWRKKHEVKPLPGTHMYLAEEIRAIINFHSYVDK